MLVSGGVEDKLRMPGAHGEIQPFGLADVADDRDEIQLGEAAFQLQAQLVHRGLGVVEEDELLDVEGSQLAAELGADGSGRAGHEHDFLLHPRLDLVERDLDLRASEQVLDADLTDAVLHVAPTHHLVDGRSDEGGELLPCTELDEFAFLLRFGFGGEEDGAQREALDEGLEIVVVAEGIEIEVADLVLGLLVVRGEESDEVVVG